MPKECDAAADTVALAGQHKKAWGPRVLPSIQHLRHFPSSRFLGPTVDTCYRACGLRATPRTRGRAPAAATGFFTDAKVDTSFQNMPDCRTGVPGGSSTAYGIIRLEIESCRFDAARYTSFSKPHFIFLQLELFIVAPRSLLDRP